MIVQGLINAANNGMPQDYFNHRNYLLDVVPYGSPGYQSLDTGLVNYFDFDDGRANCSSTEALFGKPREVVGYRDNGNSISWDTNLNLWSCAFYTNLTRDFRDSTLPSGNVSFLLQNRVDTSVSSASAVTSVISTCLDAWCRNSNFCGPRSCRSAQLTLSNSTLSAAEMSACITDLCAVDSERSSNPDIAGIGVLTAIFMQLTMAVLLHVISLWTRLPSDDDGSETTDAHRGRIAKGLSWAFLVDDFQRAQCCFAIAVNIAAIVTLRSSGSEITRADKDAIALASYAGTLPTSMIYTTLVTLAPRMSPYTTILTVCTWVMTLTVRYLPQERADVETTSGYFGPQPTACGSNSPRYVCDFVPGVTVGDFWYLARVFFEIANCGMMIGNLSAAFLKSHGRLNRYHHCYFIYLGLIALFCAHVKPYIAGGTADLEWSFGQIVAVTVWLPSLLSFINDLISAACGTRFGRRHQLRRTYQLPPHLQIVGTRELVTLQDEAGRTEKVTDGATCRRRRSGQSLDSTFRMVIPDPYAPRQSLNV